MYYFQIDASDKPALNFVTQSFTYLAISQRRLEIIRVAFGWLSSMVNVDNII
jgi:hypothetical protein